MRTEITEFFRVLSERGPGEAASAVRGFLSRRYDRSIDQKFDRRHGVDTTGISEVTDYTLVSDTAGFATWYEPTSTRVASYLLKELAPAAPGSVFVDYGSGKGKMLLLASRLPFKRIIGVEFAKELVQSAVENAANYRDPQQVCFEIESLNIDATEYELPDEPCVIFMFAPFRGAILKGVIERIQASYQNNPRAMYIAYAKPFHGDEFAAQAFLTRRPVSLPRSLLALPYGYEIFETAEAAELRSGR